MPFADVRAELLRQKKLFVDPDFPPNLTSLYASGLVPVNKPANVQWKRPWVSQLELEWRRERGGGGWVAH